MNDIHDNFAEATRIAAGDDGTNYDNVAIALHWLTAALVVVQFALAVSWDYFSKAMRHGMESVHISLGVLLTAEILARIAWRLMPGHQRPAIVSGWVRIANRRIVSASTYRTVPMRAGSVLRKAQGACSST